MKRRALWTVAGVILVFGALFSVSRAIRDPQPPPSTTATAPPAVPGKVYQWRDFAVPDAEPISRPIASLEDALGSSSAFGRGFGHRGNVEATEHLTLHLQAVITGEKPMALISGRIVRLGESIDGYRLASVDRSGVVIVGADSRRLQLSSLTVPRPETGP